MGSLWVIIDEMETIAEALPVLAPQPVAQLEAMRRQLRETNERLGREVAICNKISLARSANSNVHHAYGRLYPLPLPDGGHPDGFSDTLDEFMRLNREQLNWLIQQYGLLDDEQPRTNAERREVLGVHWGVVYYQ